MESFASVISIAALCVSALTASVSWWRLSRQPEKPTQYTVAPKNVYTFKKAA